MIESRESRAGGSCFMGGIVLELSNAPRSETPSGVSTLLHGSRSAPVRQPYSFANSDPIGGAKSFPAPSPRRCPRLD